MIIQTLEKKYIVTEVLFSDRHMDRYICHEEDGGERYTVVCVKDRVWIRKAMQFLIEQIENTHFTDFVSCFFSEACLYVVLKYEEGISLEEKLGSEDCPLQERIPIGKSILERVMLMDMPDYFACDCLRPGNVMVSPALEVSFRYELSKLRSYHLASFIQVQARMEALFGTLFSQERKQDMFPPISSFCHALRKGEYQDIREIYTAYDGMSRAVETLSERDIVRPHTRSFCLWDRIKRYLVWCRKMAAILLMLFAVAFLIYTLQKYFEEGREKIIFKSIGTLQIRRQGEDG